MPAAPQPSLLMLRYPFAGHALGLGNLVGGHLAGDDITVFLRLPHAVRKLSPATKRRITGQRGLQYNSSVGRERSHHWFRSGSKAGMPAMTRRKQGLTRRDGGRPVYRQTQGLYPSSVDCRKVVDWVAWKDPGVAPGGSPSGCSSKGQELRLLVLVGFAALCRLPVRLGG